MSSQDVVDFVSKRLPTVSKSITATMKRASLCVCVCMSVYVFKMFC
jgi:hypothetical protein